MGLARKIAKGFLWCIAGLFLLGAAAIGFYYMTYRETPPAAFAHGLDHPAEVVLYSLNPSQLVSADDLIMESPEEFAKSRLPKTKEQKEAEEQAAAREQYARDEEKGKFHHYKILGKTLLKGEQAQQAAKAFASAASLGWLMGPLRLSCFDPRHGLRVTIEGHHYDYLLCYACSSIAFYRDWEYIGSQSAIGSSTTLNGLLTAAHIELAPVY